MKYIKKCGRQPKLLTEKSLDFVSSITNEERLKIQ